MRSQNFQVPFVPSEVEGPPRCDPSTLALRPKFILSAAAKPQAEGLGTNGFGFGFKGVIA
jgi:hypothetical protein